MPHMDWKHEPLVESFRAFKARMELFFMDQEITDDAKKAIKIKIALGDEGVRRIMNSGLTQENQRDPKEIWKQIESEVDVSIKINFRIHRLEYSQIRQRPEETITGFISRLREKASRCEFENEELNERLIEMIILSTPFENFRKELMTKPKGASLAEILEKGREYEAIQASSDSLFRMNTGGTSSGMYNDNIDMIKKGKRCTNCGLNHRPRSCPAYNATCHRCGKLGHWMKTCKQAQNERAESAEEQDREQQFQRKYHRNQRSRSYHNEIQLDSDDEAGIEFHHILINDIACDEDRREVIIPLLMEHTKPRVSGKLHSKLDTGAGGNTLPVRTYKQMFGSKPYAEILKDEPNVRLTGYSGTKLLCHGSITLSIRKKTDHKPAKLKFYVVDVPGPVILGLPGCLKLDLIQFNIDDIKSESVRDRLNTVDDLTKRFPGCFDGIGEFNGEENLHVAKDAIPSIDPPRRVSLNLKDKIKAELERMVSLKVIRKVEGHTDWCSSLAYAVKKNGDLRMCLDPHKLNKALKRCPHNIPTVEEITPALCKAKFFTKLDAKAGYWSVKLAKGCQELTTFRTPFGRYCFMRLPFGLSVSQDIFQARMDSILEKCEGCVGISDDIVIYGSTEIEHDERVLRFMEIAMQEGLKFNQNKCIVKSTRISFFGRIYTDHGVYPDPEKVEDILRIPSPKTKLDLQRFLGMANFLANHLQNFSVSSSNLRDLTKKDTPFTWDADHEKAFNDIKKDISDCMALRYYDPQRPVTLEVDASMKGMGSALIQDGAPISFASKTLTTSQANYSNIERECLAVICGIQRFHHYLYGRYFTVVTDHKPLEMIFKKPLRVAPPRLQRMMLKVQGYDFDVQYRPGNEMTLADTLSRMPNVSNTGYIDLDSHVEEISMRSIDNTDIDMINFSEEKRRELRAETTKDHVLHKLAECIFIGWPEDIKYIPNELRNFWTYRDELAVEDGIIFKGRQVIIPETMQDDILSQLHSGHQGIEKTRALSRESVYWPGLYKNIENLCNNCELCQEALPRQTREPLINHERPNMPWIKLGTDLFEIRGEHFIIISDYYSRFPIVRKLSSGTSEDVIEVVKETFSLFGVPQEIISDNGPCYLSKFDKFCHMWGVKHTRSSPRFPKSNGFIERQIGYLKPILRKCIKGGEDIHMALLNVRATPLDCVLPSPAELIFGRPIPTALPSHGINNKPEIYKDHMHARLQKQKDYADLHSKALPPLIEGQRIRVFNKDDKIWSPAKVVSRENERSYRVQTEKGNELVRNRIHLRETGATKQPTRDEAEPTNPNDMDIGDASSTTNDDSTRVITTRPSKLIKTPIRSKLNDTDSNDVTRAITTRYGRLSKAPIRLQY